MSLFTKYKAPANALLMRCDAHMPQPSTQTRKRSGSSTSERSAGKTGTQKRISEKGLTWKKFLEAYDRVGPVNLPSRRGVLQVATRRLAAARGTALLGAVSVHSASALSPLHRPLGDPHTAQRARFDAHRPRVGPVNLPSRRGVLRVATRRRAAARGTALLGAVSVHSASALSPLHRPLGDPHTAQRARSDGGFA